MINFPKWNMQIGKKKIDFDIQVMMLGARRVGKTSVLASMINRFNFVTQDTNLTLSKVSGARAVDDALNSMKGYFNGIHKVNEPILNLDTASTPGFDRFDLKLEIAGKKNVRPRKIRFLDCAGEWITEYQNEEKIGDEIEQSSVIVIAIDSVILMEKEGKYNGQNCMEQVTNFIKSKMCPDDVLNSHKMVLFVPLKCEKYFHQNEEVKSIYYGERMKQLNSRIKEEYSDLLGFLMKPNNKSHFTVAILPILTLGGIEFDEFLSSGSFISTEEIQYRFCEPNKFEPLYCEQPLLYSLMFEQEKINKNYYETAFKEKEKNKKRVSAMLKEWIQDKKGLVKDVDYIKELEKLKPMLERSGNGFEIIQDPLGL